MKRVQKRVQKRRGIVFSPEIRALVGSINQLDPVRRDFIIGHLLHHGPEGQRRLVEFFLEATREEA